MNSWSHRVCAAMQPLARVTMLSLLFAMPVATQAQTQMSKVKHVFIILMENHNWTGDNSAASAGDPDLKGSSSAPYINSLIPLRAHAEQYFNPPGNHPSLPNYLWLEAGTNLGVTTDNPPSTAGQTTTQHLVTQLVNHSPAVTWKAYAEPDSGNSDFTDCPQDFSELDVNHVPFAYFSDTTNGFSTSSPNCIAHVVPYSHLATDLAAGTVAQYNFITPNLCHDGHEQVSGCASSENSDNTRRGDDWLSVEVPKILNSAVYQTDGALFILWDEAEDGGNFSDGPIGMFVLSPFAKTNYQNSIPYDHNSMVKTFQEIFNVTPLLGAAANTSTTDLSDFFLSATGPAASLSPTSLAFGNQTVGTSSASQSVTLTNNGPGTLSGISIAFTGTNSGDFAQTNTCGSPLAANATCTISVTFTPAVAGARSAALSVADNASGSPQTVSLTGTGVAVGMPVANVSPTSLTFGGQTVGTTSAAQTVTLSNTGGAALTISSIAASGDFAESNSCGSSLAAGGNCTISVTFTPTASGTRTGSLSVTDNASGSPQTVSLTGTGSSSTGDFSLSASPTSGTITAGQSTTFTLSLTPAGGFNQEVSLSCAGAPQAGTCSISPSTVTPNGSSASTTTITVTTTAHGMVAAGLGPQWIFPALGEQMELTKMLWLIAMLGFPVTIIVGRRRQVLLSLGFAMLVVVLGVGCSGPGTSTTLGPGTPTGTYTLTLTGTSGTGSNALTHSIEVTLIVD